MYVENYKEVFLTYSKKNNYEILHADDREILEEFVPFDDFMEEIRRIPVENIHWKKQYKWTRILEWFAFGFSIYIFLVLAMAIYIKFISAEYIFILISYELWMSAWTFLAIFLPLHMWVKKNKMNPNKNKYVES